MGGWPLGPQSMLSMAERIHPTVPSPPQAETSQTWLMPPEGLNLVILRKVKRFDFYVLPVFTAIWPAGPP